MKINRQKAFTLIELLIVVAIVGLLTSVIAVGFGNARLRSRDAKRLSDMGQIKTGLDLFYTTAGGYPDEITWNSGFLTCNGQQFMEVPRDPALGVYYMYDTRTPRASCGGNVYREYYVEFTTEGTTDLGPPGTYYLSTRGFTPDSPF